MRTALICLLTICLTLPAAAQVESKRMTTCFDRVEKEPRSGDTITIYTDTGTIFCRFPSVSSSSSMLHVTLADTAGESEVAIPFESINRIKYTKPDAMGTEFGVIGLVIGGAAGAAIGSSIPVGSGSSGSWGPSFHTGEAFPIIGGAVIGGVLGLAIGSVIGSSIDRTVVLKCD